MKMLFIVLLCVLAYRPCARHRLVGEKGPPFPPLRSTPPWQKYATYLNGVCLYHAGDGPSIDTKKNANEAHRLFIELPMRTAGSDKQGLHESRETGSGQTNACRTGSNAANDVTTPQSAM